MKQKIYCRTGSGYYADRQSDSFAGSEAGAGYFGAELAKNITAHAEEIKLAGAEYCDCPACAAVAEILARKKNCCEGFSRLIATACNRILLIKGVSFI